MFSMFASDTAQGAAQGLIPDLVPEGYHGRTSGIKALLEIPLPLLFVSFFVSKMISKGDYWGAILSTLIVLFISMTISLFVPERSLDSRIKKLEWHSFLRLVLMTVVFTIVVLLMGEVTKVSIIYFDKYFTPLNSLLVAFIGFICIIIAIIFGVTMSIHIGIGSPKPENSYFLWVINRLTFLVGSVNLSSFMIYFLQERFSELSGNNAAGPASFLVMFVGISVLLSIVSSGWLIDKYGNKPIMVAGSVLATLGTLIALLSPLMEYIYLGGGIIGLGIGMFYVASWALGTKIVPKKYAGQYLGVSNLAGAGAGAVGAYLGGPIADAFGYIPLFIIYGLLFTLSTVALVWIKEQRSANTKL